MLISNCVCVCYCYRPGSTRADAFRGQRFSFLGSKNHFLGSKNHFLRDLQLLLFPLESPPSSYPDWKGYLRKNSLSFHSAKELYYWQNLYQQPVYMPLHRGGVGVGRKARL